MSTPIARPTQPVISPLFWPVLGFAATVVFSVVGGGWLSGLLSGHGGALPAGFYGFLDVIKGLFMSPADPASAWPEGSRPGGPVLTWVCIGLLAVLCMVIAAFISGQQMKRTAATRERAHGFADRTELKRQGLTEKTAVKKAKATQASLAQVPLGQIDAETATTRIGKLYGTRDEGVYLQYRDGLLVEGPTGSGKTWRLCWQGVTNAVGTVVVTTTRGDLLRATWADRIKVGAVYVFDPERLTAFPQKMKWSILAGCDDPETAKRRAEALVQAMPMDDTKNSGYWNGKAAMLMRGYLYAAAVLDVDLRTVRVWAASRNVKAVREVLAERLPDWDAELAQALGSKSDSSDDVISACTRLLEPLASPALMESVNVPRNESVDLKAILAEGRNTIYLVSEGHSASAAAFTTVLSAELYHLAKTLGLKNPDDRLDPPLRMVLDEMNNVAAIPNMPSLITDSGARGIQIWAIAHSALQNEERWGRIGGRRLSTDSPVRIYLPGLGDEQELTSLSRLLGTRDEYTAPHAPPRSVPIMSPNDIRQMPQDQALMIARQMSPAKLHLPTVWDIPDLAKRVQANQDAFDWYCETAQ
ncbi:type IV secretory system conjugative DNA transfer family protein [Rhodococcus sp. NPDC058521]|uniref:type IV secretory system conjugative DNA transfer family protein n=1 Tax=Rhodococcus sp. NPDC058521 TaxID=3346536 RepID=UPI00364666CE